MIAIYLCAGIGAAILIAAILLSTYFILWEIKDENFIVSEEAVWIVCCMLICGGLLLGSASLSEAMMLGGSA